MNFIFDPSLVLYLPLNELDGASFMSMDKHRHLATVSGALWTPRGISFDGADDKISIPANACFALSQAFTLIAWYNPSSTPASARTLIDLTNGNTGCCINLNQMPPGGASAGAVSGWFYDTAWRSVGATSVLTIGQWIFLGLTYNQVNLTLFTDGQIKTQSAYTGAVSVGSTQPCMVGATTASTQFAPGLIGEAWVYNRALTPLEIQRNYLATKWRYK